MATTTTTGSRGPGIQLYWVFPRRVSVSFFRHETMKTMAIGQGVEWKAYLVGNGCVFAPSYLCKFGGCLVYAAQSRGDAVGKGVRTRFLEVRSQVVVDEMLRDERNQIL